MRLTTFLFALLLMSCSGNASPDTTSISQGPNTAGLPKISALDRLPAPSWLNGTTAPAAIPLACDGASLYWENAGAGLMLDSAEAAGMLAYAIYRLTAPLGSGPYLRAHVDSGTWLMLADFERGCWQPLTQAQASLLQCSLGTQERFSSPGGKCYIAVIHEPGTSAKKVLDVGVYSEYLENPNTDHYVSPDGSDLANGNVDTPWLTLQHAADSVEPGDNVIIRPGEYAGFDLRTVATESSPIVFQAEPGVVITSENPETGRDGINIENAAYITLRGFTVTGVQRSGIRVAVSDHVTVEDCRCLTNGVWGIFTGFADYLTLQRNVCIASDEQHGIYTSNSGDYPTVRGNVLAGNSGCGLHMNGDISMGGDGIISHALVEGNVIFDNGVSGGSGINCDGVQESQFINNLLYNNHASGITLFQIDGGEPSYNNTVINNTVVQADDGRWCMNIVNASTDNTVRNNIFYSFHSWRGSLRIDADCLSGLVSDYNVIIDRITNDDGSSVISLNDWQNIYGQDTHSVVVGADDFAALFPGNLLQLGQGSSALNAGSTVDAPVIDIAGTNRPQGSNVDCGAWELIE